MSMQEYAALNAGLIKYRLLWANKSNPNGTASH